MGFRKRLGKGKAVRMGLRAPEAHVSAKNATIAFFWGRLLRCFAQRPARGLGDEGFCHGNLIRNFYLGIVSFLLKSRSRGGALFVLGGACRVCFTSHSRNQKFQSSPHPEFVLGIYRILFIQLVGRNTSLFFRQ
jgi:hypothetical protein